MTEYPRQESNIIYPILLCSTCLNAESRWMTSKILFSSSEDNALISSFLPIVKNSFKIQNKIWKIMNQNEQKNIFPQQKVDTVPVIGVCELYNRTCKFRGIEVKGNLGGRTYLFYFYWNTVTSKTIQLVSWTIYSILCRKLI